MRSHLAEPGVGLARGETQHREHHDRYRHRAGGEDRDNRGGEQDAVKVASVTLR